MRKFLSLSILICLSFTLISCGQKDFIFEDDSEIDFLGATFSVYSADTWGTYPWLSEKRSRGGSASGDRFLDRIEKIESDYNVKIYNEYENIENRILAMTLNGGSGVDMLFCENDVLYRLYQLGILTPFEEIGVKNHSDIKFGIPSMLFEGTFDRTQYGIINYLGDSVPDVSGLITVNMNLLEEFGMDDPHEYVEKGEWNWENFRKVLAQGRFNDGETDHYAMVSDTTLGGTKTFFSAIISNGGYIIREIDGLYRSGLCEPNAIEAMEFMVKLVNDGLIQIGISGITWDLWVQGDKWPMNLGGGLMTSADIPYSIVRFPYGPNGNRDIVPAFSINRKYYAFTILSGFTNDEIGLIVDDLFEPLDASVYPEGWKDYAVENIFYSDADHDTYLTALDTMDYYPIALLYGTNQLKHSGEIESAISDILFGRGTAQAKMDSVSDLLKDIVNEKLNGIK